MTTLPLIPGAWRALGCEDSLQLMVRYAASGLADRGGLATGTVGAVRTLPLACIDNAILVAYDLDGGDDDWHATGAFVWRPNRFVPLEGDSTPFHELGAEGLIRLDDREQAEQYARLFCAIVAGEEGSFDAMQPGLPMLVNHDHPLAAAAVAQLDTPPAVVRDGDHWSVRVPIAHGSAFFMAGFRIGPSGAMEMAEEERLYGAIPAHARVWRRGLRFLDPSDPAALDAHPDDPQEAGDR